MRRRWVRNFQENLRTEVSIWTKMYCGPKLAPLIIDRSQINPAHEGKLLYVWSCGEIPRMDVKIQTIRYFVHQKSKSHYSNLWNGSQETFNKVLVYVAPYYIGHLCFVWSTKCFHITSKTARN